MMMDTTTSNEAPAIRDVMMAQVKERQWTEVRSVETAVPVPEIDQMMALMNSEIFTSAMPDVNMMHEAMENEEAIDDTKESGFWFLGLVGACNIVAARDDVPYGVGYVPNEGSAEQIVRAHNAVVARLQKARIEERVMARYKNT